MAAYAACVVLSGLVGCQLAASTAPHSRVATKSEPTSAGFDPSRLAWPDGCVFWVAQQDPAASDANPGSPWQPWKTLGRATATLQAGDVVVIRAGTYRETVRPARGGTGENARITYVGHPGETVVISAADLETRWTPEGAAWWTPFTLSLPIGDHVLAAWEFRDPTFYSLDAMRRQQAIQDGVPLRQVEQKAQLVPGTFWVEGTDAAPTRIYVRTRQDDPPSNHVMEIGMRSAVFNPCATCAWLRVKNLTFRYGTATYHQRDRGGETPFWLGASNGIAEDVMVEWANMDGIWMAGSNHVWRRVVARYNGLNWGGPARNSLFEDCKSLNGNPKGQNPAVEAGGTKWAFASGNVIRRFEAGNNFGIGIWFDINNSNNVVEDSLVYGNTLSGIQIELNSNYTTVRDTVVYGTRDFILDNGEHHHGYGIHIQGSSNNTIVHNTVYGNGHYGIGMGFPDSRAPTGGNRVYNNISAYNDGPQYSTWGSAASAWGGNLCWPSNCGSLASIVADPLLANKADAKGYHLTAGSPARGKGVTPPVAVVRDIDGQARPATGADLGADQYSTVVADPLYGTARSIVSALP